jgi:hypothetical protein
MPGGVVVREGDGDTLGLGDVLVGEGLGDPEGEGEGDDVGEGEGLTDGDGEGDADGLGEGDAEGEGRGLCDGLGEGLFPLPANEAFAPTASSTTDRSTRIEARARLEVSIVRPPIDDVLRPHGPSGSTTRRLERTLREGTNIGRW